MSIFDIFKRKNQNSEIRDVLFGDLPITEWPKDTASTDEPWGSFIKVRQHLDESQKDLAIAKLKEILSIPNLESRHYLQAWHFLRQLGIEPEKSNAKKIYGVVVEVAMGGGLDIVVAYSDNTARYFNYSGSAVIWDASDSSLKFEIESVLSFAKNVVRQIGPWEDKRPKAPSKGMARINILCPSGLHFGEGPFEALSSDPIGGQLLAQATQLMQALINKTEEKKG